MGIQVKNLTKTYVSIPMQSGIESLNVGVAFAVIGYQLFYKKYLPVMRKISKSGMYLQNTIKINP